MRAIVHNSEQNTTVKGIDIDTNEAMGTNNIVTLITVKSAFKDLLKLYLAKIHVLRYDSNRAF